MEYIKEVVIYIITVLVLIFVFLGIKIKTRKTNNFDMTPTNFIMRIPNRYAFLAIFFYGFWGFLLLASSTFGRNETSNIFVYITFASFALLSIILFYSSLREQIIVENNTLFVTPLIGIRKRYNINDIDLIKVRPNKYTTKYKFYIKGKKIFSVYDIYTGLEFMFKRTRHVKIK